MWSWLALGCLAACRINFDIVPDAPDCPSTYTAAIAGTTSLYAINSTDGLFAAHHAECLQALPGATHLASIDSDAELTGLATVLPVLPQPTAGRFYIGAVQRLGETNVSSGWLNFNGAPTPPSLWNVLQPDDMDAIEDGREQLAALAVDGAVDVTGDNAYGAICECDGTPLAPEVVAALGAQ